PLHFYPYCVVALRVVHSFPTRRSSELADLPVGYYPDDEQARKYELKASEGHSYAHYLLIEQSLHYTKPSGFLIMLIPETLFSDEKSTALHTFFHKYAHIIGLIQLDE